MMGLTADMWIALLLLAAGVAIGAGWKEMHGRMHGEVKDAKEKEAFKERNEEIKRLRTQVASLIGTEYCHKCHAELLRQQQPVIDSPASTCCGDATHGCMGPPR